MTGPRLCLGTVQFGLAYGIAGPLGGVSADEARAILAVAGDLGIRRLDTAPAYGDIEGRLLDLAGPGFEIVTKIPSLPTDGDAAAFVHESLERSRARLGEAIAGVLFHTAADLDGPCGPAAWAAAAAWCDAAGVPLGVSEYGPEELARHAARFPVAMAQLPASAFDQRLVRAPAAPGIELTARSLFVQGLLLMPPAEAARRLPAAAAAVQRWQDWREASGLSALGAALAVAKGVPGLSFCAIGVDSVAQLEAIAAAWDRATPLVAPELAVADPAVLDPRRWEVAA